MADRDASEPLLRDRSSASPPSPRRTSDADMEPERRWSGGSDGPMSAISAAVRNVQRIGAAPMALPGVVEPRNKTVSVFYWSMYDSGESCTYMVDVLASHSFRDLLQASITYFAQHSCLRDLRPENYLLRAADKKNKPKTHFPAFGLTQSVMNAQLIRFALCSKRLDDEAKRKLEDPQDEEDTATQPPAINAPAIASYQAEEPRKCCRCQIS